jgi:hypothetical protein
LHGGVPPFEPFLRRRAAWSTLTGNAHRIPAARVNAPPDPVDVVELRAYRPDDAEADDQEQRSTMVPITRVMFPGWCRLSAILLLVVSLPSRG